ncbi:hypothetical protein Ancab_011172 [Ancistrocladus abbreviatus]
MVKVSFDPYPSNAINKALGARKSEQKEGIKRGRGGTSRGQAGGLGSGKVSGGWIIGTELFKVLREKWGSDFDSFISKKVTAVIGDVTYDNLGVNNTNLREQMLQEIDVVVNSAATTNFYDRYQEETHIKTIIWHAHFKLEAKLEKHCIWYMQV